MDLDVKKANPPSNLKTKNNTTMPMTRYELLMRLNSDWITKQTQ